MRPDPAALFATVELLKLFIDWRHKMMLRVVIGDSAVIIAAYTVHTWGIRSFALLFGAAVSLVGWQLDRVNRQLLDACYQTGEPLERAFGMHPGVFTELTRGQRDDPPWTWAKDRLARKKRGADEPRESASATLSFAYLGAAASLVAMAIYIGLAHFFCWPVT